MFKEIKNESVYRAYLTYENAANEIKKIILEQIEKDMDKYIGDTECYLGGDFAVTLYEDEYDANNNDVASVIYKNEKGQWIVEGETTSLYLDTLSVEKMLALYRCFEKTVEDINNENE